MAHDRDVLETRQPLLGLLQRLRRDVDQVYARRAASRLQRLGEQHQLLAAAASQLDDRRTARCPSAETIDDLGVRDEQAVLGARDAIPRQPADRLEQARSERVVEVLRLKLLRRQRRSRRTSAANSSVRRSTRIRGMIVVADARMRTLPSPS